MRTLGKYIFRAEGDGGGSAGAGAGQGDNGAGSGDGGGSAWSFDTWSKALPEADRTALTAHIEDSTKGLKSALEAERTKNKSSEKTLSELLSKVEKGSEAEKQLQQMQADLKEREMQISFLTSANTAGCVDLELALAAVKSNPSRFTNRDDSPNWEALKQAHPMLFSTANASANAGAGAGGSGGGGGAGKSQNEVMNKLIRGF